MSFAKSLNKAVDDVVLSYIKEIASKYNLDSTELRELWNSGSLSCKNSSDMLDMSNMSKPKEVTNMSDESKALSKLTVSELKVKLSDKGMKVSGTKSELIERLLNPPIEVTKQVKNVVKKEVPTSTLSNSLNIRRNTHNNYEHSETHLVFNNDKKVYGMQLDDGTVKKLCPEHIQLCNKYKFEYILPENLDTNKSLKNVKIKELEEDDDFDEEDDVNIEDIIEEGSDLEEDVDIIEEDDDIIDDDIIEDDE